MSTTLLARVSWRALCGALIAVVGGCATTRSVPQGGGEERPAVATAEPSPPGAATASLIQPDVPSGADAARDRELAARAAPIVDAFLNVNAFLTPDGRTVVFSSNRDGLWQLYAADAQRPDAPPRRLVSTAERIPAGRPTHDGLSIVFRSDHGADENWSIYRVDLDGGNLVELTPGAKLQRDLPFLPDGRPGEMVYSARAAADTTTGVFVQELTQGSVPRMVYNDPSPGSLLDVSRDGRRALHLRVITPSESLVLLLDLETGSARRLYPAEGRSVVVYDATFSPDGRLAYVATDEGAEAAVVLALDAATGREVGRYLERDPATARIPEIAVAKRGGRIALRIDAGDHSELRLLDAEKLAPVADVRLPLGTGALHEFSDDGRRIGLTWSTPDRPTDVFAVDARTGEVVPLRAEARHGLEGLPDVETSIATIRSFDGTKIPVNLYLPRSSPANGWAERLPVLVTVHGGPASSSAVRWNPFVRFFSALGYAVVEPNIRGSTGFGRVYEMADDGRLRLNAVRDVEAVGRWAAAQPWADPNRLVIQGGSYGGYIVLMALSHQPELWGAGLDLVGVVNLRTELATTTGFIQKIFRREFGDVRKDGEFLDSISPITHVSRIRAPVFVYAGANDPRVPRPESDQIVSALRKRGGSVEYMVKENEGHSLDRRDNQIELFSRAARFVEEHLGRAPSRP